mmetsp:Transcript_44466/g.111404  ORF Transcript_44466/g.111404 Transcript_44466/m.111404 type:complete len:263 (-) Transcript_44466:969-1757(-)
MTAPPAINRILTSSVRPSIAAECSAVRPLPPFFSSTWFSNRPICLALASAFCCTSCLLLVSLVSASDLAAVLSVPVDLPAPLAPGATIGEALMGLPLPGLREIVIILLTSEMSLTLSVTPSQFPPTKVISLRSSATESSSSFIPVAEAALCGREIPDPLDSCACASAIDCATVSNTSCAVGRSRGWREKQRRRVTATARGRPAGIGGCSPFTETLRTTAAILRPFHGHSPLSISHTVHARAQTSASRPTPPKPSGSNCSGAM